MASSLCLFSITQASTIRNVTFPQSCPLRLYSKDLSCISKACFAPPTRRHFSKALYVFPSIPNEEFSPTLSAKVSKQINAHTSLSSVLCSKVFHHDQLLFLGHKASASLNPSPAPMNPNYRPEYPKLPLIKTQTSHLF